MKAFLVIAALALASGAYAGQTAYGVPEQQQHVPQTYKHVYVHVAPDEPADHQSRTIRVPGGDKHVNIIFVKAPSQSSSTQTEVILPEQDEHKNLVYVLLKKGENTADVRVRGPAPTRPTKPEVYFIRYKDQQQSSGYGPPPAAPVVQVQTAPAPSSAYGTPF